MWILVRYGIHGCERKRWGQEFETAQQEMLLSLVAAIFVASWHTSPRLGREMSYFYTQKIAFSIGSL